MAHPSKNKGNGYERELVEKLKRKGFEAERARGSDGRAFGESEDVDLKFRLGKGEAYWLVQAKRRKALASYLNVTDTVDMVIMRGDRGPDLAVVPLYLLLGLIRESSKE
ncbi:MAG: hypothetical protein LC687_05845 [Actinobacteria bacterium]|nr:hypothetical protein [Actinomycetota bacterium]